MSFDKLAPVEWQIMDAIWDLDGSPSVRDVWQHLYPSGEKAYTTVQTIMNNLERKGFLARRKIGLVNFYTAVFSREAIAQSETSELLSRVFKGSVHSLTSHLLNVNDLSMDELKSIKDLLLQKEMELKENSDDK